MNVTKIFRLLKQSLFICDAINKYNIHIPHLKC